jgi:hypothetical protein
MAAASLPFFTNDYGTQCFEYIETPAGKKKYPGYDYVKLYHQIKPSLDKVDIIGVYNSIYDLPGDGIYTWIIVNDKFYATEYSGSGPEWFTKHLDILLRYQAEILEANKHADKDILDKLISDFSDYESYVERLVEEDKLFAGELKKEGDTLYLNLYSGTFMLKTEEIYKKIFMGGHGDVNAHRFDKVLHKLDIPDEYSVEYTDEPFIVRSSRFDDRSLSRFYPYFHMRLFKTKGECEAQLVTNIGRLRGTIDRLEAVKRLHKMLKQPFKESLEKQLVDTKAELAKIDAMKDKLGGIRYQPPRIGKRKRNTRRKRSQKGKRNTKTRKYSKK